MTSRNHEPCPFCGYPMEWAGDDYLRHRVQTPGCPIALSGYSDEAAWNRRAYQIAKPSADLVDAVAATLQRARLVQDGGYREQADAVIALFAARENAAAELLRAAYAVSHAFLYRNTPNIDFLYASLAKAIDDAKAAGIGGAS